MILKGIMSRPLRIEYPDAWYHIMNRGRRSENIFSDEKDYIYLTRKLRRDTLKEIGAQFGIDNESTVSSVMERMKNKLAGDRKFVLRLHKIAESITKS